MYLRLFIFLQCFCLVFTSVNANTYFYGSPTGPTFDIDNDTTPALNTIERIRSNPQNLLENSEMEYWYAGTSTTPSLWTSQGSVTVSRSSTAQVGSYSCSLQFTGAGDGELFQYTNTGVGVDYVFTCYAKRTSGTGTARLVAQDANSPFTEFYSADLTAGDGDFELCAIPATPTSGTTMRFAIKQGSGTSTWLVDECTFIESKNIAFTWQSAPFTEGTNGALRTIVIAIGDATNAITTASAVPLVYIPMDFYIDSVEVVADASGSIVVDLWQDTYANFPPTVADTITASAKPTLASAQKSQDSTLTGWTKKLVSGNYLKGIVDSSSTVKYVLVILKGRIFP